MSPACCRGATRRPEGLEFSEGGGYTSTLGLRGVPESVREAAIAYGAKS